MTESAKDAKGQAKEKLGDATGDKDTKREGQADQAGEKTKAGVEKAVDKVKGVLDKNKR